MFDPTNPLIVQGDKSVLLEATNALYGEARDVLARFAELEKSPEYIHTYRITPLSLWNAASAGMPAQEIVDGLTRYEVSGAGARRARHRGVCQPLRPRQTAAAR